ncbi:MAG TPA: T9SS type A sorting domain-containing protein [Chitinophagales bacterium]|nr:T9SS type A sorting domain-containing protein [Chitinophagales bacterium]
MKKLYALGFALSLISFGFSQTTYQSVYNILQQNCTGSCHTQANPQNLVLEGTPQQVYTALVNATPVNSIARTAGNLVVDPGNPRNSFLFIKINHGLDYNLQMANGEGIAMPDSNVSMSEVEREMVRQWILFGARDTGTFLDSSILVNFYVGQGGEPRVSPLAPPAPGTGVQLHWGPMFVNPGVEIQYNINTYINNSTPIDISSFTSKDNPESHHFAIFKYHPGHDTLFAKGMIPEMGLSDVASMWYNADLISQYPKDMQMDFPAGTGLVWDSATVLSLSYHMINYRDSILAAEGYLNMYYHEHVPGTTPVLTAQVIYHYPNVNDLIIPNDSINHTFTINQHDPDSAFLWNIISIQAHTHKYGVGYDIWTRKPNGDPDSLIYDGGYDPTYTYNFGQYEWSDPPYRKFDPPYQVDMRNGLIHKATYNNSSNHTVNFGISTEDEMYISFIMYYKSDFPSAIGEQIYSDDNVKVYPNPVSTEAYIKINSKEDINNASFYLYDLLGNQVAKVEGINQHYFRADLSSLANGCYIYRLTANGKYTGTGKLIVQH